MPLQHLHKGKRHSLAKVLSKPQVIAFQTIYLLNTLQHNVIICLKPPGYHTLKNINSANFKTPYDNKVYVLSELNGRILSFGKGSNSGSFYIPVSFEFDNKGEVVPGAFVEVFLLAGAQENTLTLPVSALTNEMGVFYVYVQLDEEGYRKQEVTVGGNNGKEVQILKGLHAGERVVTRGAYQVKMASASGAIPHGHSHEH